MKFKSFILLAFISLIVFSCADDLANVGVNVQPDSDQIKVCADTFYVETETVPVEYIYTRQDSFLLGNFYNSKFGTTQADILAQVKYPLNFTYPEGSIVDSAVVVMYTRSRFGDSFSSLDINIYEMNKETLSYTKAYPSNILYSDYTDKSIKIGQGIVTAKNADSTNYSNFKLSVKLTDEFKNRFKNDKFYGSNTEFLNFFKGMYITSNFGSSTLLNVLKIDLQLFYHYTYKAKNSSGVENTITVNNILTFPANKEVRQINRFSHPGSRSIDISNESLNYVASPANLNTKVVLPLGRMNEQINKKIANKQRSINSAILKVEATEVADSNYAVPPVYYMLLVREDSVDNFFINKKLPSSTSAILGQLEYTYDESTLQFSYFYNFDCTALIATELKSTSMPASIPMRLIPVEVKISSKGVVTEVRHSYKMSAITIRSGKNTVSPMKINMVYSGF